MAGKDKIFEEAEIKRSIQLARKQTINFAFNRGKKPEGHLLALDKRKAPKILSKMCLLEGEGKKAGFGTAKVEGKELHLTVEKELVGMQKAVKQFLRTINLNLKVLILDAEGKLLEGDDEEEEEDAAGSPPPKAGNPDEENWNKRFPTISATVEKVLQSGAGDASKIRAVMGFAQEKADGGDFASALKALNNLEKLLAEAATSGSDTDVIAKGIVEKRKFMVTRWQKVPTDLKVELGKLKTAISTEVPDENPDEICNALEEALNKLVSEIQSALDDSINKGEADYASALTAIEQQKSVVKGNPVVQLLRNNPMMKGEDFEKAVIDALDDVRDNLAA